MGLWEDLLKSLKKKTTEASKKALESGKGELSNLAEHPFETIAKKSEPGKLTQAFSDMMSKNSLKSGKLATGLSDLSNISQKQAGDIQSAQYNPNDLGLDVASAFSFGILTGKEMGNRLSSKTPDRIPLERLSIASEPQQQFQRQLPMQFVPGHEGSVIGGQGEVDPGYGMQSPQSRIPPAYLQMAQAGQTPQLPNQQVQSTQGMYPGALAGLKEGFLGMPSSAMGREPGATEQGRQTAYYAGKLIPDIIRSKLGVNTAGEEARQQQLLESYGGKKITPEYQSDLNSAVGTMKAKGLSEEEKIFMFQKLAAKYPARSSEIRRIFFPQSQDNNEALLAMIASGMK